MSVRKRLEEARLLMSAGNKEGALTLVLVAAAATARKRYPKEMWGDGHAFKNFIYDEMGVITNGPKYKVEFPFQGHLTPLEDIFYVHLRCHLIHEGEMPRSIELSEPLIEGDSTFSVLKLTNPLGFPLNWIESLATAIWLAPENDDLWSDEALRRHESRLALGSLLHDGKYCKRPNSQRKKN